MGVPEFRVPLFPATPNEVTLNPAEQTSRAAIRKDWVDVAKGVCILLVVLYHVVDKYYSQAFALPSSLSAAWTGVVMGLVPLRMPLFFLISGFLASRSMQRPWRTVLGPRVLSPYYLYLVWLIVHTVWFAVAPDIAGEHAVLLSPQDLLLNVFVGLTSLWYLYALAVYFVIAKFLRRAPWLLLAAAAGTNIVVEANAGHLSGQAPALLQNVVFFALGAFFPAVVLRLSEARRKGLWGTSALVVLLAGLVAKRVMNADSVPGLLLVLSILACIAGVAVSAKTVDLRMPGCRPLAALGRRTLPIYVLHLLVLSVVSVSTTRLDFTRLPGGYAALAVYPLVVTLGIVVVCVGIQEALHRIRLGFLLAAPESIVVGLRGPLALAGTRPRPVEPGIESR